MPLSSPGVRFPEPEKQPSAENGLEGEDPVLRVGQPEWTVLFGGEGLDGGDEGQPSHEDSEGQNIGPENPRICGGVSGVHLVCSLFARTPP